MTTTNFSPCIRDQDDDGDHDDHRLKVVIVDAGSKLGVEAARGFLKDTNESQPMNVTALVEDKNSPDARDLISLGAKVIVYSPLDPATIRAGLGQSGASTLVLIPPATNDLVTRTNNILLEAQHTIKYVYLWSSVGTDDAMLLPPDTYPDSTVTINYNNDRRSSPHSQPNSLTLLKEAEELVMHDLPESMEHVILRAGFPLQSFFYLSNLIQNRGAIPFTSDTAHVAPIDLRDIGRVTCRLFHNSQGGIPDDRRNKIITLTGAESQSGPMIVSAANSGLPHPLAFAKVNMSDMRAFLLQTRISPFDLSLVLGWWQLFTDKRLEMVTSDLKDILFPDSLGSISNFFADHTDQFLPPSIKMTMDNNNKLMERFPDDWEIMSKLCYNNIMVKTWDSMMMTSSPTRLCNYYIHDVNVTNNTSLLPSYRDRCQVRLIKQVLRDISITDDNLHQIQSICNGRTILSMIMNDIQHPHELHDISYKSKLVTSVMKDINTDNDKQEQGGHSWITSWNGGCIIN